MRQSIEARNCTSAASPEPRAACSFAQLGRRVMAEPPQAVAANTASAIAARADTVIPRWTGTGRIHGTVSVRCAQGKGRG